MQNVYTIITKKCYDYRDSSVGLVTRYGQDGPVSDSLGERESFLGLWVDPACCKNGHQASLMGKIYRGVVLTTHTHPILVPGLKEE